MSNPFYYGQEDYIDKLNALSAISTAAASPTALTVTKTGNFLYTPIVGRVPTPILDNLDGTSGTDYSGKSASYISYSEGSGFTTAGSTLSSLSFDDLVGAGSISFDSCKALQTLQFPALTSCGLTAGLSATNALALTDCSALTTVSFPALVVVGGNLQVNSQASSVLTTLSLSALKQTGGLNVGMSALTTLSVPLLQVVVGTLILVWHALTTFSLPSLTVITTFLWFSTNSNSTLTTLSVPNLASLGGLIVSTTYSALTALSFPSLQRVGAAASNSGFDVTGTCVSLSSITLPAIVELAVRSGGSYSVRITASANLVTFTMGSTLKVCAADFVITGAKLNQASVDGILARLAALDGTGGTTVFGSGRTVNLSGGTSSTPSSAGLTSKATLVARGVTVTHN